jgi:hypothetical protein
VLLVGAPLATFLVAGYPGYRSAVAVAGQTPSREAVDGLVMGAAVMASFAYELIAATLVVQLLTAACLWSGRRFLLPIASLCLFACAVFTYVVGKDAHSPLLFVAAGTNAVLGLISAIAFGRGAPSATTPTAPPVLLLAASLVGGADVPAAAQGAPTSAGRIGYAQAPVARTGIRFPRLTRFTDADVMSTVNRQIDEITREFGCHHRPRQKGTYYRVRSQVEFASHDVFSIYASAAYDCGGGYPTNDRNCSVTFDLRTGRRVEFEDLFRSFGTDKALILDAIFRPQIDRALAAAASGRPDDGSCEADTTLFSVPNLEGSTFAFTFSRAGLKVQPEWPHSAEACAETVVVPYSKLREYAAAGGILERVAK